MALRNLLLLLTISSILGAVTPSATLSKATIRHAYDLHSRLNGEGVGDCWSALLELKSCTSEIVLFFLDGETYLGVECCRAIRIITLECWPTMLTSIGFTAQEGDILRGYCDAKTPSSPAPVQTPLKAPPVVA